MDSLVGRLWIWISNLNFCCVGFTKLKLRWTVKISTMRTLPRIVSHGLCLTVYKSWVCWANLAGWAYLYLWVIPNYNELLLYIFFFILIGVLITIVRLIYCSSKLNKMFLRSNPSHPQLKIQLSAVTTPNKRKHLG